MTNDNGNDFNNNVNEENEPAEPVEEKEQSEESVMYSGEKELEKQRMVTSRMEKLAPTFKPVAEIRNLFQNRVVYADDFNEKFKTDRRALINFINLKELENFEQTASGFMSRHNCSRLSPWADIYIGCMMEENSRSLKKAKEVVDQTPPVNKETIVIMPKEAARMGSQLLLIKAVKSLRDEETDIMEKTLWDAQADKMAERLEEMFVPANWLWFTSKGEKNFDECETMEEAVSKILFDMYEELPVSDSKILTNVYHVSMLEKRYFKQALASILNETSPVTISRDSGDRVSGVLSAVAGLGFLERVSEEGWEEEFELKEPGEDSPLKKMWDDLDKRFAGASQDNERVSFNDMYDSLVKSREGVTSLTALMLIALQLRKHKKEVHILKNDEKGELTVASASVDAVMDIGETPLKYVLSKREETREEKKYIQSILEIFASEEDEVSWASIKNSVYGWFDKTPGMLVEKEFENPEAGTLLKHLAEHRDSEPDEFALNILPSMLGFEKEGFSLSSNLDELISKAGNAKKEIDEKLKTFYDELWKRIAELFEIDEDRPDDLDDALKTWLGEVNHERYRSVYHGDTKIFFETVLEPEGLKDKLMFVLPGKLGMGKVQTWTEDKTGELIARIDKARFQVSVMKYLEMKSISDKNRKRTFLTDWLIKVMDHLEFNRDEREALLEEYLAEITG